MTNGLIKIIKKILTPKKVASVMPEKPVTVEIAKNAEIGEILRKSNKLLRYIQHNFNAIIEMAPSNANYVVGFIETINSREVPTIHYFVQYTNKGFFNQFLNIFRGYNPTGALDFMMEHPEHPEAIVECKFS